MQIFLRFVANRMCRQSSTPPVSEKIKRRLERKSFPTVTVSGRDRLPSFLVEGSTSLGVLNESEIFLQRVETTISNLDKRGVERAYDVVVVVVMHLRSLTYTCTSNHLRIRRAKIKGIPLFLVNDEENEVHACIVGYTSLVLKVCMLVMIEKSATPRGFEVYPTLLYAKYNIPNGLDSTRHTTM